MTDFDCCITGTHPVHLPEWVKARSSLWEHRTHSHSLDELAGYVVREVGLEDAADLAWIDSPVRYGEALSTQQRHRRMSGTYSAVIDTVYTDGCRS